MKVTDVRAVIAIGLRGQFGLRGRLPWEANRGREYVADVERFFELAKDAEKNCPVSKVLNAEITLDAKLG
jgi:organic hydroperoxide reductase OsmC/OhrA